MSQTDERDEDLINKARAGDKRAFDALVLRYQQSVFNIIYFTMGKTEHADDIAQNVFVKVYHALDSYQAKSAFSTWLYRITVNTCIDESRRQKRRWLVRLDDHVSEDAREVIPIDEEDRIEHKLERDEMRSIIHREIAALSETYRIVITLRDINELSYDEIAKILRCKVGTIKSRLFYARLKLRDRLKKYL